ncbi:MAG: malto-oligosyltrehalose synthase [Gammaproteobacteria bacterium]|nr:malto-oligosyltrehalose synthase [Gammaproteobacteria bacterium]
MTARALAIPTATYRWQFHAGFPFREAQGLVAYLADLGISHCYASPYLRARRGSVHGYDIADHAHINPEIGSEEDHKRFLQELRSFGMGQILDIVPNHMSTTGYGNIWWQDVLENGQASLFADYFDIDWDPPKPEYAGKVLLPILGDQYGAVLERGDLRLVFDEKAGSFQVRYYDHRLPVDPRTYPRILNHDPALLARTLPVSQQDRLLTLVRELEVLGERTRTDRGSRQARADLSRHYKRSLAHMVAGSEALRDYIGQLVALFCGVPGEARSFDALHELLEEQAYRVASWRVASYEINYRRFFDVNELVALRAEDDEVFAATHRLILAWIAHGQVDGLRIDHPDGLHDPCAYYRRLQAAAARAMGAAAPPADGRALYVVVEKILARQEQVPGAWPIHGTTGYDFTALLGNLFVNKAGCEVLTAVYQEFVGAQPQFEDSLYECKSLVMRTALAGELFVLTNMLDKLSEADRHTRDFTRTALASALFDVVACFPVYRTYMAEDATSVTDAAYIQQAVARARVRNGAADLSVFDFIERMLLRADRAQWTQSYAQAALGFAMRFQQYTAPVMAKGLEDTLFYRYNRLVSLNEVGGDPSRFGISIEAFHHVNEERLAVFPHAMLCTSSHDTKRSEDTRARINVLSEMGLEWGVWVREWARMNAALRTDAAPSRADEMLFYQTVVGVWPLGPLAAPVMAEMRERIQEYMTKAMREAKVRTNWLNPDVAYEKGVTDFINQALCMDPVSPFVSHVDANIRPVMRAGLFNSLSQVTLKLSVPGVPDIYQGTESWDFSLVDPDNRRPVDYALRRHMAQTAAAIAARPPHARRADLQALLADIESGLAKFYVTRQLLRLRRHYAALFGEGSYQGLEVRGERRAQVVAFVRRLKEQRLLVVVPCQAASLLDSASGQIKAASWGDTAVEMEAAGSYEDALTGRVMQVTSHWPLRECLADFPVAVCLGSAGA